MLMKLQFGTNHLGHFALTARLMNLLQGTKGSRVVNVASGAHKFGKLDFDDLTWEKRQYKGWRAYGDSKTKTQKAASITALAGLWRCAGTPFKLPRINSRETRRSRPGCGRSRRT